MSTANNGYALGLGSTGAPAYPFLLFCALYALVGGAGTVLVAVGLTGWPVRSPDASARWFLPIATIVALVIPILIRLLVLREGAVADDESVYRFSAELIASGRLSAPSHRYRLFFDHAFVVNDGTMFSQYFLGWPAIMALGVPFATTGYVNAFVSAATVPALYALLSLFTERTWARLGVIVFLTAPMIQIAAATEMSHTSALATLVYAAWLATVALRSGGRWAHFGFGLFAAVSFFIRPASAVAIMVPWVAVWLWRQVANRSWTSLLWFGLAVVPLAALFLWVNFELTGSPFRVAYQRAFEYGIENDFRFSHVLRQRAEGTAMLSEGDLASKLSMTSIGLLRLNMSLFGWPISFAFLPFAVGMRHASLWWASVVAYIATHFWVFDAGIDTFGPTHWFEMALPILVLSMLGAERATRWTRLVSEQHDSLPRNLVLASAAASLLLFTPIRAKALARIGAMTGALQDVVEARQIRDAVIFVNRPWGAPCDPNVHPRTVHFVFWWPMNDPDLENEVIWANHLSIDKDWSLLETFPGRRGYVMRWRGCGLQLMTLEEAETLGVPNGFMGPHHGTADPYTDDLPITGEPLGPRR